MTTAKNTCDENECEDGKHVVFKCKLYDTCRAKYASLFFTANNLKEFLAKREALPRLPACRSGP